MIHDQLEQINAAIVETLVENRVSESTTVEFKATLPDRSDKGIFEFLKDVCAMANSAGGDIAYGVRELDGVADSIQPIGDESEDKALLRLGQMLDSGVEPRIAGTRFHTVPVDGGYVLVIRIPQSFAGPHRVVRNGQHRFPLRNERHVSDMSYDQLRTAFDRTSTLAEAARKFRVERLERIASEQELGQLDGGATVVVHVLPLAGFSGMRSADVRAMKSGYMELAFSRWPSIDWAFNFDGFLASSRSSAGRLRAYTQLFRSGAVELFAAGHSFENHHGQAAVGGLYITGDVRRAIEVGLKASRTMRAEGGALVAASVTNVQGRVFSLGTYTDMAQTFSSDRDRLVLGEQWIENVEGADVDAVARPILDVLWQSFGVDSCLCYNDDGVFDKQAQFR